MGIFASIHLAEGVESNVLPSTFLDNPIASGEDLLLAAKMLGLSNLAYNNVDVSQDFATFQETCVKTMKIERLKIWNDRTLILRKVQSQAITGIITDTTNSFAKPKPFVAFRGTASLDDVIHDLMAAKTTTFETQKGNKVGGAALGFVVKLKEFRKLGLINYIADLVKEFDNGLFTTGHSLGGALASLLSAELTFDYPELFVKYSDTNLVEEERIKHRIIEVTFGSPRAVDGKVAHMMNSSKRFAHYQHLRFVNEKDLVPTVPYSVLGIMYHTGDCYFSPEDHPSRAWYVAKVVRSSFEGDSTDDSNVALSENQNNFASDYLLNKGAFKDLIKDFVRLGGDPHKLLVRTGYLGQLLYDNGTYRKTLKDLQTNSPDRYTDFQALTILLEEETARIEREAEEAAKKKSFSEKYCSCFKGKK